MRRHWTQDLVDLGACSDAVRWAKDYSSLGKAWKACPNPDWMVWIKSHLGREIHPDRKPGWGAAEGLGTHRDPVSTCKPCNAHADLIRKHYKCPDREALRRAAGRAGIN